MEGRGVHQQVPGRSGLFSSCKESAQAYISKRGGGWTRSAIRMLDRSFYAEEVQIYFQHVRRYASFRRFDLQVVVELQLPLLWWLEK